MVQFRRLHLEQLEHRHLLAADVIISEFMASNKTTLLDEDGESSDWIELFNAGPDDVNLAGWHLTDDVEEGKKWSLPPVDLTAGSFLVVFASDKDRTSLDGPLHTNFKLTSDGEYLALTRDKVNSEAVEIVSEFEPAFPQQYEDISYGISQSFSDEGELLQGIRVFFKEPSPGTFNSSGQRAIFTDAVRFSHPHGFYDEPFSLTLETDSPSIIRYTLDGSEPHRILSPRYTGPIRITGTETVRARAFQTNREPTTWGNSATYLFLDDIVEQSPTGRAPRDFPSSRSINGQVLDYGMDPDIVEDPVWGPQLEDALTQIPSISLLMDTEDLFDWRHGIYVNARQHGKDWEKPASLELINPDGSEGFHVDAGVRIRGGFSRSGDNPKHAFRLFFREPLGAAKLEFPLFGEEGVDEFDKIDFRTAQNYSWSFQGDRRNTFLRDVFSRDLQRELGQPYTRSRYYHFYINGQYWGLYQSQERAEAKYAASYFGGDDSDYDVVKSAGSTGDYENEATDGTLDAYRRLANLFYQAGGLSSNTSYYRAQGMNTDGTRNPDFERLLDVDNLIDYAITTLYVGDRDGPFSRFVNRVNNYFGIYNRENPDGFKFFEHDSEHSLDTGFPDLAEQPTTNGSQFRYFNPLWMHERLAESNADYRLKFADRILGLIKPGGILSDEGARALLASRAQQIETAIIAESARWGDAKRDEPFTKTDWLDAVAGVDTFFDGRGEVLLEQFRNMGWLPNVPLPVVLVEDEPSLGGPISQFDDISLVPEDVIEFNQTIVRKRSTWRYLDDGSDPGTAWRGVDFDDSDWKRGRAELGYGDGNEATRINSGPTGNHHITSYFRLEFDASSPQNLEALRLSIMRDDGAVVYLNGEEVARSNMPVGAVDSSTRALNSVSGGSEESFFPFRIDPTLLKSRDNVLAVEVHQRSRDSSDVSFDLELVGGNKKITRQTIYYTLDSTDPRKSGGGASESAIRFSRDFSLPRSGKVLARSQTGTAWSALTEVEFVVTDPDLEMFDDKIIVNEGQATTELEDGATSVLANDLGLQDTPIRVTVLSSPKHDREFELNADGTFRYEHNGDEVFTDSFRYRVTNGSGKSDTGTVEITVLPISDSTPNAEDDSIRVIEGGTARNLSNGRTSLLANDVGLDDSPIAISIVREPEHARSLTVKDDGTFAYAHDGGETRSDSFAYRIEDNDGQSDIAEVSVTISPRSDTTPLASRDRIVVEEGMTATQLENGETNLLANDNGLADVPIVVSLHTDPDFAAAFELRPDGTFSYTHDGGDSRTDSFRYRIQDNDGQSSISTVSISISPVDDGPPIAVDDQIQVREGRSTRDLVSGDGSVLANDEGLDDVPVRVTIEERPKSASQFSLNPDGTFFYRHNGDEVFSDFFTYQIVDDDGDIDVGMVTIEIEPVSDSIPRARTDSIFVTQGGSTTELVNGDTSLLDNDRQLSDGPVLVSLLSLPSYAASLVLNSDGTFEYQHDGSLNLRDEFDYQIFDNDGQTSTATVSVTVERRAIVGDFNSDAIVDDRDLELLFQGIRKKQFDAEFDLNDDAKLDDTDYEKMIVDILQTRRGDANLDGTVSFADFLVLSTSFGSVDADWSQANFDLDEGVTFADFLYLSNNFGYQRDA